MTAAEIFQELTMLGALGADKTSSSKRTERVRIAEVEAGSETAVELATLCEEAIDAVESMAASHDKLRSSLTAMLQIWRGSGNTELSKETPTQETSEIQDSTEEEQNNANELQT